MMISSDHRDTAPGVPLPLLNGSAPWMPAPSPMPLDDWAALLGAVTGRLQRLVDAGDTALSTGPAVQRPLQECIDALRLLQLRLQDSLRDGIDRPGRP